MNGSLRFRLGPAALLLFPILAGCAGSLGIRPYESGKPVAPAGIQERRLWDQGKEFDQTLSRSGQLYPDEALQAYLQSVMDRLYPEFQGALRVRVLKSPVLNAFALPHGSLYIHLGLLTRLDNEAQAATVLAHEGAHFVKRHSLRQARNVKLSAAFAQAVTLAGIPLAGDLLAVSSISGYSRDLEREADAEGFERLRQAGYDTREAQVVFRRLAAEAEALGEKEPFFFSSHPRMRERMESFEELRRGEAGGGRVGETEYLRRTEELRQVSLEEDLALHRYKSLLLALEDEKRRKFYPPSALYYLGEAYRQRAGPGDETRAEQAWLAAVQAAPGFAPSYRALGIHYLKREEPRKAEGYLLRYLELAPKAPDRGYVRHYLKELQGR